MTSKKAVQSLLICMAALSSALPTAAGMRAAARGWTPATPATIANLKTFLTMDMGPGLISRVPAFAGVAAWDAGSELNREIAGAMALPPVFLARPEYFAESLRTALRSPEAGAAWVESVARAYEDATPLVAEALEADAKAVFVQIANQGAEPQALSEAKGSFEAYARFFPGSETQRVKDTQVLLRAIRSQDMTQRIEAMGAGFQRSEAPALPQEAVQPQSEGTISIVVPADPANRPEILRARPVRVPASRQLALKFNETVIVNVGGVNVEARVYQNDIEDLFHKHTLRLLSERKDGTLRVGVAEGVSAKHLARRLSQESIVHAAMPRTGLGRRRDQVLVRFHKTVLVKWGGINVESSVNDYDIASLFRKHGLRVTGMLKSGAYKVSAEGKTAAALMELLGGENIVRSVSRLPRRA